MRVNRILLPSLLLVIALVVQAGILARLHLPGAVPDLVLLVVVALAVVYGPVGGCLVGFAAGLLSDLAPPADHAVGRYALVLCLIGYLAGLVMPPGGPARSAAGPMLVVAGAALGSTVLYAAVGALVGDTAARHVGLGWLLASALLYDLLLAPFTVPWIMVLARRLDPDPVAAAGLGEAGGAGSAVSGWLSSGGRSGGGGFGGVGRLSGTGRIRIGPLRNRPGRVRAGRQRVSLTRSPGRGAGLGRLGRRP